MSRRARLIPGPCLALALACHPPEGAAGADESRPRNAILISIDTLRPDHLSCYGHPRQTSPNIDGLARSGARFTDVTAAAPWTLPSHATMLTGLYPSHHGVKSHQTRLPDGIVTVAEEFRARGFETFAVVNSHNVGKPQFQLGQGFDRFRYIEEVEEVPGRSGKTRLLTLNNAPDVVAEAQAQVAGRAAGKPFFLFLHFYDVHTDFTPRADFREEFVAPYSGKLDGRTQQLNGARNRRQRLSDDDLRFLREMYAAEIRTFDEVLGGFLAWLAAQDLADETLVVVTSDHGEEFQEHGGLLHGRTQYQELLLVPLIVAGPGVPAGTVIDVPAHGVDVTPTLLGAMGIRSEERHDGLDLSPLWRGETLPERMLFGEADQDNSTYGVERVDTRRMVRRGREKLIVDLAARRNELYDLGLDPGEQHDLSSERADLVRELAAELARFGAGAIAPETIAGPSEEERQALDALGYGGGDDGEDQDQ